MTDWFRPIAELRARGYTLESIGREIGVSTSTVWRYQNGQGEPRESVAEALRALEKRIFGTGSLRG
jgi:transcriptional regulator with XRE-family HTH domain